METPETNTSRFWYEKPGTHKGWAAAFNGKDIQPREKRPVKPGENIFTWAIQDEPNTPYTIIILSPPQAAGTIRKETTSLGDDNGIKKFEA